jgi:hypothetical protein
LSQKTWVISTVLAEKKLEINVDDFELALATRDYWNKTSKLSERIEGAFEEQLQNVIVCTP